MLNGLRYAVAFLVLSPTKWGEFGTKTKLTWCIAENYLELAACGQIQRVQCTIWLIREGDTVINFSDRQSPRGACDVAPVCGRIFRISLLESEITYSVTIEWDVKLYTIPY